MVIPQFGFSASFFKAMNLRVHVGCYFPFANLIALFFAFLLLAKLLMSFPIQKLVDHVINILARTRTSIWIGAVILLKTLLYPEFFGKMK